MKRSDRERSRSFDTAKRSGRRPGRDRTLSGSSHEVVALNEMLADYKGRIDALERKLAKRLDELGARSEALEHGTELGADKERGAIENALAEGNQKLTALGQSLLGISSQLVAFKNALAERNGHVSSTQSMVSSLYGLVLPWIVCLQIMRTRSLAPLHEWRGARVIARSGLFHRNWYLENNSDVAASGMDPIWHYVKFGASEGRDPSKFFSTRDYLLENPDVAAARINPLLHFIRHGAPQRRRSTEFSRIVKVSAPEGAAEGPQSKDSRNTIVKGSVPGSLHIPNAAIPTALANAQRWCKSADPEVSIVIINWNAAQLTLECVRHIWANTQDVTYEIIIADNGSGPNDTVLLKKLGSGTRLLELGTNRFFGEANNIAAEQANGRYICLLNNDSFVQAGWLRSLVDELNDNPEAGAAGPMFIFPDNTLQEAGGAVDAKGYPTRFGRNLDPAMPEFNLPKFVDYISAAALLIEKELFLDAGGFDLAYEPAYYEDTDLCFKLRAMGRKTRYCPTAKVVHIEGSSANDDPIAKERRKILGDLNRDKFVKRWGRYLETRSEIDLPQIRKYTHSSTGRQPNNSFEQATPDSETVAVYTPFALTPGGGERYILTLAAVLSERRTVTIVSPHQYSYVRLQNLGREFDLDLSHCRMMTYGQFVSGPRPAFMFTLGNHVIPPVAAYGASSWYHCQFPFPRETSDVQYSRNLLAGYQGIIVNSKYTRKHMLRALRKQKLAAAPIEVIYPPVSTVEGNAAHKRNIILNVGRFFVGGHSKRQDILIETFRTLAARSNGDLELHLAGSLVPEPPHINYVQELQKRAEGLAVRFHINPTKDALFALYRDAAIYWHGTGLGADIKREPEKAEHFGISIVEAMSAECVPLAFDAGGPREIITNGVNGFLYCNQESLVNFTLQLLDRNAGGGERTRMGHAARAGAAQFKVECFVANLRRLVTPSPEFPSAGSSLKVHEVWATAGSEDAESSVTMEPEVAHGAMKVHPRVQS
jgi:GT2 family glycosyltransferase/glycosyltransferase involved in cell wall biosynthesis